MFHSTGFHLSLSLFTLLGPGRQLIVDGLKSFFRGAPNMNTLVGLGALSSFTVSSLAAFIPKLVNHVISLSSNIDLCLFKCKYSDHAVLHHLFAIQLHMWLNSLANKNDKYS